MAHSRSHMLPLRCALPPPGRLAPRNRRRGGFTLLELAIVLAIVAVLSAIAAPRFSASMTRYKAEMAARRVVADLAWAAARARQTSRSVTVLFDPPSGRVTLVGVPGLETSTGDYTTALGAEPYMARIASVDFGGDARVVFDGYGAPDSGGSAVIAVGDEQRTVALDAETGKATIP